MGETAPIVLFVYNRAEKMLDCLNSLKSCKGSDKTDLFIFADGAKNEEDLKKVENVRECLSKYEFTPSFSRVNIEYSDCNKGLAPSVIYGVTKIINQYGRVIVVEDDLIVSSNFIEYMNQALEFYHDDERFGSISAHSFPLHSLENYAYNVFATRKGDCWGWGTWKNRWERVDWSVPSYKLYLKTLKERLTFEKLQVGIDEMLINQMEGRISSWAVRWCYHLYKEKRLTIYPKSTLTFNIGLDDSGTHCGTSNWEKDNNIEYSRIECYDFDKVAYSAKLEREDCIYQTSRMQRAKSILKILYSWLHNIF